MEVNKLAPISDVSSDSGFNNNVRNWMHYNTLYSSLTKQTSNARKIRNDYEKKIIDNLQYRKMENAVIKTNSGVLNIVTENPPKQLTLTRIQSILEDYFIREDPNNPSIYSAENIMNHIKTSRGTSVAKYLKLSSNAH